MLKQELRKEREREDNSQEGYLKSGRSCEGLSASASTLLVSRRQTGVNLQEDEAPQVRYVPPSVLSSVSTTATAAEYKSPAGKVGGYIQVLGVLCTHNKNIRVNKAG